MSLIILLSSTLVFAAESEKESLDCEKYLDESTIVFNSVTETKEGNFLFEYKEKEEISGLYAGTLVVPTDDSYRKYLEERISTGTLGGEKGVGDSCVLTRSKWDSTSSFMLKLVCKAEVKKVVKGTEYWKLTYAKGEIIGASGTSGSNLGSGVYMTRQELTMSTCGRDQYGSDPKQILNLYPSATTRSWKYTAPSNWIPVRLDIFTNIGANLKVTARRGTSGSTWTTTLVCNVFDN